MDFSTLPQVTVEVETISTERLVMPRIAPQCLERSCALMSTEGALTQFRPQIRIRVMRLIAARFGHGDCAIRGAAALTGLMAISGSGMSDRARAKRSIIIPWV